MYGIKSMYKSYWENHIFWYILLIHTKIYSEKKEQVVLTMQIINKCGCDCIVVKIPDSNTVVPCSYKDLVSHGFIQPFSPPGSIIEYKVCLGRKIIVYSQTNLSAWKIASICTTGLRLQKQKFLATYGPLGSGKP